MFLRKEVILNVYIVFKVISYIKGIIKCVFYFIVFYVFE